MPGGGGHERRPDRERLAGAGERGEAEAPAGRDGPDRAVPSPEPAPPGWPSRAGTRGGRAPRGLGWLLSRAPPGAPFLPPFAVCPGATFFQASWCQPLGRGLPSGQGWALDWREESGDPGVGAKPHLPSRLPLFWSQAIGRPVLKRKGGARGKSGFWGHGRARWNHLQRSFVGEGSSIGSSVAFVHSVIQLSQHVYRGPSVCKVARRLSKE